MSKAILDADEILHHATPFTQQHGHEVQPWFIAEHVIDRPVVRAE